MRCRDQGLLHRYSLPIFSIPPLIQLIRPLLRNWRLQIACLCSSPKADCIIDRLVFLVSSRSAESHNFHFFSDHDLLMKYAQAQHT